MGRKPRQAPQSIPDSLPKRDERRDAEPDAVRGIDPPAVPPDSLPKVEDEEELEQEIAVVDSARAELTSATGRGVIEAMTLHFAYGSNMSRALMAMRCPGASALGIASLSGWRFVINPDGVGSIAPRSGALLRGVLWRVSLRDLAAINAYEGIDAGLYLRRILPVKCCERVRPALIYIARRAGEGRARPGYISLVADAAREWGLPESYIRSLQRWSPSGWRGALTKDTGEFG